MNYAFAGKYLAEVSFRYDGSYKFAEGQRWGFFPAVSLEWRISEENFFRDNLSFINNFKIRGSYGKVGDEGSVNPNDADYLKGFQYLTGYTYPSGNYVLGSEGVSNGAKDKGMANENLTWYESTTANVGFDALAWEGLLSVEFDYFVRRRDGLAPWLTQQWTRHICEKAYGNRVEGIVGNEDVGQMSAWYILAASGIHPACPRNTRFEITSPVFDRIEFDLDPRYFKGNKFTIVVHNNSNRNIYIQKALLNGVAHDKCFLDFREITGGGKLELFMGSEPNKNWGI